MQPVQTKKYRYQSKGGCTHIANKRPTKVPLLHLSEIVFALVSL